MIEIDGKIYEKYIDACEDYGISLTLFTKRRERGMSVEEALKKPLKRHSDKKIIIDGTEYSVEDASRKCAGKIPEEVIARRLRAGKTLEESLNKKTNAFVYDGVLYRNAVEACRKLGIPEKEFRKRRARGMSIEDALRAGPETSTILGFPTIAKACKHYGVKPARVYYNKSRNGMDPEQAILLLAEKNKNISGREKIR